MTGGKMPEGTDTVIMQEHVTRHDQTIAFEKSFYQPGQNVRHIGEDIPRNTIILRAGRVITPADIGLLASVGIANIGVHRRIRVALFSTGDELVPVGQSLKPGQLHDSNRYTLNSLLNQFGAEIIDLGVVADKPEKIESAFICATAVADVLITSGGVSVGDADFVKSTLEKLGQVNFWKIAMKPGRPLAFGKLDRCHFFGLPGNPVSAMVTFYQFVLPALKKMSGQIDYEVPTIKAMCSTTLTKRPGRLEYQRGILEQDSNGKLVVRSTGAQGSHILSSMSNSNCFIILPEECEIVTPGSTVDVQPFSGFI
jgi:molybdopterin molybdotransferase